MRSYSSRLCSTSGSVSWISSYVTYPRLRPNSTSARSSAERVLSTFSASAFFLGGAAEFDPDIACALRGLGTALQLPVCFLQLSRQCPEARSVPGALGLLDGTAQRIDLLLQPELPEPLSAVFRGPPPVPRGGLSNQKSAQERDRRLTP